MKLSRLTAVESKRIHQSTVFVAMKMRYLVLIMLFGVVWSSPDFTLQQIVVSPSLIMEPVMPAAVIYESSYNYIHHVNLFGPHRNPSPYKGYGDDFTKLLVTSYNISSRIFGFQSDIASTYVTEKIDHKIPMNKIKYVCQDWPACIQVVVQRTKRGMDLPESFKLHKLGRNGKMDKKTVKKVNSEIKLIRQIISAKDVKMLDVLHSSDMIRRLEDTIERSAELHEREKFDFLTVFHQKDNVEDLIVQNTIMSEDMHSLSQVFKGFIPQNWLPETALLDVIMEVTKRTQPKSKVVYQGTNDFYDRPVIDRYEYDGEQGIFIHMNIPVSRRKNSTYKIYRPIAIPSQVSGNTICKIDLSPQLILKNEDNGLIYEISEKFFEECSVKGACNLGYYEMSIHRNSSCFNNECSCQRTCYDSTGGFDLVTYNKGTYVGVAGSHVLHMTSSDGIQTRYQNNFGDGFTRYTIPCGTTINVDDMTFQPKQCAEKGRVMVARAISKCVLKTVEREGLLFEDIMNPNFFYHLTVFEVVIAVLVSVWSAITLWNVLRWSVSTVTFIVFYNILWKRIQKRRNAKKNKNDKNTEGRKGEGVYV